MIPYDINLRNEGAIVIEWQKPGVSLIDFICV